MIPEISIEVRIPEKFHFSLLLRPGVPVSFTVSSKVPRAGQRPEAEFVFLDEDQSNSSTSTSTVVKQESQAKGAGKGLFKTIVSGKNYNFT